MFSNFFVVALRTMLRNKGYTSINVFGLVIGMAVALLTGLWVHDELSFDKQHDNYDRIVIVHKGSLRDGQVLNYGQKWLPFPLIETLKEKYSQSFKRIVAADPPGTRVLATGNTVLSATGQFIEPGAPEMLSLRMLSGSFNALEDPTGILISASLAKSLFGDDDAQGQPIRFNNVADLHVTGVYADLPDNSSFASIKYFVPWQQYLTIYPDVTQQGWKNHFVFIYGELAPGVSLADASTAVAEAEWMEIKSDPQLKEDYKDCRTILWPMRNWHLKSSFKNGHLDPAPMRFVMLVGTIGGFVLLLACVNFMNLSTARSVKRAKEVGVRKSIGSQRWQIATQFFNESLLIVAISFCAALGVVWTALPWFNTIVQKTLVMPFASPGFWLMGLGLIVTTSLIAGSYPAFYLSSFRPASTLKSGTLKQGGVLRIREALVVMQFAVSLCLAVAAIVVYNQVTFVRSLPVGYDREGLVLIPNRSPLLKNKHELIRQELLKTGVVVEVAQSGGPLTDIWSNGGGFTWNGEELKSDIGFGTLSVSHTYGDVVGWDLLAGSDFSGAPADSMGVVINESAAKLFGNSGAVGENVHWKSWPHNMDSDLRVLGVVKDMTMRSPYNPTKPTVFYVSNTWWINVRLKPGVPLPEAIEALGDTFRRIAPDVPFEYQFADEEFDKKFAAEDRIARLASIFSVLAIAISCLGLIGLASFMAEQRTKEIGIRKVVGASVLSLWSLLSSNFVLLVCLSCFIAIPAAWYLLDNWLQSFTYRVDLSLMTFLGSGLVAIMLTVLTVSFWIIRAARRNPVEALREV